VRIVKVGNITIRFDPRKGDGLKEIYNILGPKIRSLAYTYKVEGYAPADLEQEMRVVVWKATPKWVAGRGAYTTFIFNCMENRVKNLIGEAVRDKSARMGTNVIFYPKREVAVGVDVSGEALKVLSKVEHRLFVDRVYGGKSLEEIHRKYFKKHCFETARKRTAEILGKLRGIVEE
jgi:DNA-directed RNA polymerase specialized sigma24 family protein